ncbi:FAD-binding oxidoreductase [Tahibacter amnicola]|uniref:FAD-binding protein n=1 Tax=Tahibacter amnicola TaxID=2976241 RepID=A0ABY6BD21_9GAMM|nr:FAD-linked oxidase C-terminal domain-containing protein [Tahibacter amnicola]UXI67754.1 FAD-binding protein [Tahibacter amnicola]
MPLPSPLPERLQALLGPDGFTTDAAECLVYGYDNSRQQAQADAVAFPATHEHVEALVRLCREFRVPIVARGRGTNTTGATVPVAGGVVVSFERMNRIVRIDPDNRLAVVEPGVLNGELQQVLRPLGFFWAPDPTSSPFCTIGGNLACNAAGPRTVKYGSPRENTLGLRAVDGTGASFRSGFWTSKAATGYDLTRLLVGSEGTLALITEATLKLTPLPAAKRTLRATYADIRSAAAAVSRIMAQPVTPCALEFLDDEALRLARQHGGDAIPVAGALLMIEVDGEEATLDTAVAAVSRAAEGAGLVELRAAADAAEVDTLWAARKALSPALRAIAPMKINEDVVVPVSRLPELISGLKAISAKYTIPIVNFGHAGNGNIHVNLLYRPDDPQQAAAAPDCLAAVFDLVLSLDGTLSGEHGIGLAKREWMSRAIDPVSVALMRRIKAGFDPDGILNPGKLLPD